MDKQLLKLLLVDDDEDDYIFTRDLLSEAEGSKYELEWVQTYDAALKAIDGGNHDVYLFDYRLGEHTGLDLLRKAIASGRKQPIILLTGQGDHEVDLEAMKAGASDYLIKGRIDVSLLERSIRYAIQRKKAESELRESHQKLEKTLEELKLTQGQMIQSEKMASIGQLAAGVAHEINNPTGFVSSNLKTLLDYQTDINRLIKEYRELVLTLKEHKETPGFVSEQLQTIFDLEAEVDVDFIIEDILGLVEESREGTERIRNIVIAMKDFAHPGEDKLQEIDINKGLESTLNVVWNELKYKTTLEKQLGDLPLVNGYPQQLNQVFMNIFVNAGQAIDDMGEIKITTQTVNGQVEICISDTGSDIPEDIIPKLFDPFFTTKEVGKGTGLGLNVAYNIIQKHNGSIDVESEIGKGTTFRIRIPIEQSLN